MTDEYIDSYGWTVPESLNSTPYEEICRNCGTKVMVLTQDKEYEPEFGATVYVACPGCGNWIRFELPVN